MAKWQIKQGHKTFTPVLKKNLVVKKYLQYMQLKYSQYFPIFTN